MTPEGAEAEQIAYSVTHAARVCDLSPDAIHDLIRRGLLRSVKVGRRRLIARTELLRLASEGADL